MEMRKFIKILAQGLEKLHEQYIIHRDVHPSRIHEYPNFKSNAIVSHSVKFNTVGMPFNFKKLLKRDNFSGHLNYSPPEMIQEKNYFSEKVDVWSMGCCIYYMVAKKDPFDGKTPHETKQNIMNLQFYKQMKIKKYCNEKVEDTLVSKLL